MIGDPRRIWESYSKLISLRCRLRIQQGLAVMNSPDGQRVKEDEEVITVTDKLRVVVMSESKIM